MVEIFSMIIGKILRQTMQGYLIILQCIVHLNFYVLEMKILEQNTYTLL